MEDALRRPSQNRRRVHTGRKHRGPADRCRLHPHAEPHGEFTAIESAITNPPKLDKLTPAGTSLTSEAPSARNTLDDGAFRCVGTPAPSSAQRKWVIEPTKSALTLSGWQVTEVHYSMLEDATGEPGQVEGGGHCTAATAHAAVSGTLALAS